MIDRGSRKLVEPLLRQGSAALLVDVEAVSLAGRFSVHVHAERHHLASRRRAHDEIDVTGVEAERDFALNVVENALSAFDPPVADNDQ